MQSRKSALDQDDVAFEAQLTEKIEEMIERIILETVMNLMDRFLDTRKSLRPVCYRSDCPKRDEIPF